jgi:hypothetical protein
MNRSTGQFTIWNLLALTAAAAALMGAARLLGPQGSFSLFMIAYAFAPALALLNMLLLRDHAKSDRYLAGGLTLAFFVIVMLVLCGMSFGTEAIPIVLLATLIEWPGQIVVLLGLRLIAANSNTQGRESKADPSLPLR